MSHEQIGKHHILAKQSLNWRNLLPLAVVAWAFLVPIGGHAASNENGQVGTSNLAGSYLAGRIAVADRDTEAAVGFFRRAIELDPGNPELKNDLFLSLLSNGDVEEAEQLSATLNIDENLGLLKLIARANGNIRARSFANVEVNLQEADKTDFDRMLSHVLIAWARFGEGKVQSALELIDATEGAEWTKLFFGLHAGLIQTAAGDNGDAIARLKQVTAMRELATSLSEVYARAIEAQAIAELRDGQFENAAKTIAFGQTLMPMHPPFDALEVMASQQVIGKPIATLAHEGAAEIFYNAGATVSRDRKNIFAAIYMHMAHSLNPASDAALMMLAQMYERLGQPTRANLYYSDIDQQSPFRRRADLETAINLDQLDQKEQSHALLRELIAQQREDLTAYMTLGGLLSQGHEYGQAAKIYERAAGKLEVPQRHHWNLFYRRGVAYERTGNWSKAEASFQQALRLYPDQPDVLNYLGYSWVDKGKNFSEALDMIRKAVSQRPKDGYIIDSLGWAYYKLERFEEAVEELENAIDIMPGDPTINDHLGDAYWAIGRRLEATFQWRHSLDLEPEPEDRERIMGKLNSRLKTAANHNLRQGITQ